MRSALHETIVQRYAFTFNDPLVQRWFGHSGYANFGYWDGAATAVEASNALVDRLLAMIPEPRRHGRVLDVACGAGGTSGRLTRYFEPGAITGINIGDDQLARARLAVPDAAFQRMDAVDLRFDAGTFDVVLCVEAAHHFDTRTRFLAEALRVLKPGGWLVLSDVLFAGGVTFARDLRFAILSRVARQPPLDHVRENIVANLEAYTDLFRTVGFDTTTVHDGLARTWGEFYRRHRRFLARAVLADPRAIGTVWERLRALALWNSVVYAYPLVAAKKREL